MMGTDPERPDRAQRRYLKLRSEEPSTFVIRDDDGIELLLDDEAAQVARTLRTDGYMDPRPGVYCESPYVRVLQDVVRFPDGTPGSHVRILPGRGVGEGVAILPRLGDSVVLIRHFRHPTRSWHLEIPRGFGRPHEPPARTAARELHEEIGAPEAKLTPLGAVHPDTGILATRVHLFLAEVTETGEPDRGEGIDRIVRVPVAEFERRLRLGVISDGFALAAYARATLSKLW